MYERKIGILISYFNLILQTVIGFGYVPLLLHYIGISEYGLYQLIGSFIAYFAIMDFGLTAAVVRFYTKFKAEKDELAMENLLGISAIAYGIIALMLFMIGIICYYHIDYIFGATMSYTEIKTAKMLFLLLLFNIVLTVSSMLFKAVINAYEKFLFLKGLETCQLLLQPIIILLVLQKYPSSVAVALVQTVINIF